MTQLRHLTDVVSVSGQIEADDIQSLAGVGVRLIVNNRPDGEALDQPASETIAEAARIAGVDYIYAPVSGTLGEEAVIGLAQALEKNVRTHLFCKSGMRSAATWALASRRMGVSREDILSATTAVGYDLGSLPL